MPSKNGIDYRTRLGQKGIVRADGFQVGALPLPKLVLSSTLTFDPPSLATGAFAVSNAISIPGVALGDRVDLFPPYDTQGIMYQGSPSAADNIKISLTSCNSGTIDLASGAWGYAVYRRL